MSFDSPEHLLSRLDETCRDESEVLALSIVRFIAAGYLTGDSACWEAAHAGAEQVLGPIEGSGFVGAVAALVRSLRSERRADFAFLPAPCCRMTRDEVDLVRAVQRARAGGRVAADEAAGEVAGQAAPGLAQALQNICGVLDRTQARLAASRPNPAGRLH
jgi:hypothetical protein